MDLSAVSNVKPLYLQGPHIGEAIIAGTQTSDTVEGYKGKPFINVLVSCDGMKSQAKFWMPHESDNEAKANGKLLKLRKFCETVGIDVPNTPPDKLLERLVGKRFNGAFKMREYLRVDPQTGEPQIRTSVELLWSNPVGTPFSGGVNVSTLTEKLDKDEAERFKILMAKFNKDNSTVTTPSGTASTSPTASATGGSIDNLDDDKDEEDEPF
jgi:hypothetical protein